MKPPCYDLKTGTDCKDRCVGCSTICALWHRYVEERDKMYAKRAQKAQEYGVESAARARLQKKIDHYKPRRGK